MAFKKLKSNGCGNPLWPLPISKRLNIGVGFGHKIWLKLYSMCKLTYGILCVVYDAWAMGMFHKNACI
jgi:hypothetical protein